MSQTTKTWSLHGGDTMPIEPGMYVAYISPVLNTEVKFAEKELLSFDGAWWYASSSVEYRGDIYAWLGPLPVVRIVDPVEHVCGLMWYNPMIDPPCPACEERNDKRKV